MPTINFKKIMMTLSVALATFYVPSSFATCDPAVFLCPINDKITCVISSGNSVNGLGQTCNLKDNDCQDPGNGPSTVEVTPEQCDTLGGVPIEQWVNGGVVM